MRYACTTLQSNWKFPWPMSTAAMPKRTTLSKHFLTGPTTPLLSLPVADTREATVPEQLHRAMFTWFDALAGHRTLIPQMLGYKLDPLHVHLQVAGITRISRTVQWFMEAAGIDTPP